MKGSYLGPSFKDDHIEKTLTSLDARFKKYDEENLINIVAEKIKNEKTIGWFQGRMEFGPRALGSKIYYCRPKI